MNKFKIMLLRKCNHFQGNLAKLFVIIKSMLMSKINHVLSTDSVSPTGLEVWAGISNFQRELPAQRSKVRAIMNHPSYNPRITDNDIAIVRLAQPFTMTPSVRVGKSTKSNFLVYLEQRSTKISYSKRSLIISFFTGYRARPPGNDATRST